MANRRSRPPKTPEEEAWNAEIEERCQRRAGRAFQRELAGYPFPLRVLRRLGYRHPRNLPHDAAIVLLCGLYLVLLGVVSVAGILFLAITYEYVSTAVEVVWSWMLSWACVVDWLRMTEACLLRRHGI